MLYSPRTLYGAGTEQHQFHSMFFPGYFLKKGEILLTNEITSAKVCISPRAFYLAQIHFNNYQASCLLIR
jgi:hypothetical protein